MRPSRFVLLAVLVAVAIGFALAFSKLRERQEVAEAKAQNIEAELDALDPATRAAVVARLASDEVDRVRDNQE